jgi:RNA polymerase sigma-70 factor (ECF subfamily)
MDKNQLNDHRTILLRYALLQLHDEAVAEDAVQETLLAALQSGDSFRSESAVRTWLIGILKHKIADHYRAAERRYSLGEPTSEDKDDPNAALEQLIFDGKGRWIGAPSAWNNPDHALEQGEFWGVFEWCQKNLSEQHARAFMLREMVGLETEEICQDMNISHSACRVYLHRARLGLRECLEQRWFTTKRKS